MEKVGQDLKYLTTAMIEYDMFVPEELLISDSGWMRNGRQREKKSMHVRWKQKITTLQVQLS